jgi:hypothetical protein
VGGRGDRISLDSLQAKQIFFSCTLNRTPVSHYFIQYGIHNYCLVLETTLLQSSVGVGCQVFSLIFSTRSRGSVVSVLIRLQAGRSGVRMPSEGEDFSLLHCAQTCSGPNLTSYSRCTGGFPPRGKIPKREDDC